MGLIDDFKGMAIARRRDYLQHVRVSDNEWIVEEMKDWCDGVADYVRQLRHQHQLSQQQAGMLMTGVLEEWIALCEYIKETEDGGQS